MYLVKTLAFLAALSIVGCVPGPKAGSQTDPTTIPSTGNSMLPGESNNVQPYTPVTPHRSNIGQPPPAGSQRVYNPDPNSMVKPIPVYTQKPSEQWQREQADRAKPQGEGAGRNARTGTRN